MNQPCLGCKESPDKIGVLIAQLGTPSDLTTGALRRYLREFLWDPRVIEVNRVLWFFLLHCIILVTRPARSLRLYKRIWSEKGSPLLVITREQTELVRRAVQKRYSYIEVEFGMRYGNPNLTTALDTLIQKGCSKILLFPMYPQYSATTTGSTYDKVLCDILKRRWVPTLQVAEPYYRNPLYINALASTINDFFANSSIKFDKLVFSYHGIPEKYIEKGDPYCCMCTETTQQLVPLLKFPKEDIIHTFQSRFGKDPWLVPYTDETIENLGKQGVKNIAVACPGFTADCLETLDEIGNEAREAFEEHGGSHLELIPCLNTSDAWIMGMDGIISEELTLWIQRTENALKSRCVISCPVAAEKRKAAS
jgi:protoporphyrin/coproporphyrin ferrochelatase